MGQIALNIPVVGQSDSTEDVKVANNFTTLQTLVNGNIDPTNLLPTGGIWHLANRVAASSITAAPGDLVNASIGVTVTLPAPSANAVIGVFTEGTAGQVTVNGTNIFGPGLVGASTFKLGPAAAVILQSDGTNWDMIVGQQDTGWVALTLAGAVGGGAYSSFGPYARLYGKTVYLRGGMQANSTIVAGGTWATVPAGFQPSATVGMPAGSNFGAGILQVSAAGAVSTPTAGTGASNNLVLDGLSYPLLGVTG